VVHVHAQLPRCAAAAHCAPEDVAGDIAVQAGAGGGSAGQSVMPALQYPIPYQALPHQELWVAAATSPQQPTTAPQMRCSGGRGLSVAWHAGEGGSQQPQGHVPGQPHTATTTAAGTVVGNSATSAPPPKGPSHLCSSRVSPPAPIAASLAEAALRAHSSSGSPGLGCLLPHTPPPPAPQPASEEKSDLGGFAPGQQHPAAWGVVPTAGTMAMLNTGTQAPECGIVVGRNTHSPSSAAAATQASASEQASVLYMLSRQHT
jgi:hypothetical protein